MTKLFTQNIDWHISDIKNGTYLGEVFIDNNETQIWIKNPNNIPELLKRQLEFGFAKIDNNGYIIITTSEYESLTEYDFEQ